MTFNQIKLSPVGSKFLFKFHSFCERIVIISIVTTWEFNQGLINGRKTEQQKSLVGHRWLNSRSDLSRQCF